MELWEFRAIPLSGVICALIALPIKYNWIGGMVSPKGGISQWEIPPFSPHAEASGCCSTQYGETTVYAGNVGQPVLTAQT